MTLAGSGFEKYAKTTRRAQFLAEMERVVPWSELCALLEPVYPPIGRTSRMLVESAIQRESGREEAVHRRTNHWVFERRSKKSP